MMHMRVSINDAQPAEQARYAPSRTHPVAMGVVIAVHVLLIAAAATWKYTTAEREREPQLVVYDVDLTPPPPPPEDARPVPPPPVVQAPKPPIVLHLPQQPVVAVTPELPREQPAPPAPPQPPAAAPAPPQPVAAGDLSSSMIHAPSPRYPIEARRKREQGTVLLAVLLGTDGNVAEIRVARSSGHSRLDQAALNAVRRWRWSPTIRNGEPVQVRGTVEIPFVLTG